MNMFKRNKNNVCLKSYFITSCISISTTRKKSIRIRLSVRMVHCAAFDCNANSSKNNVTCSWSKFPTEPTWFLKSKHQTDEAQPALLASRKLVSTAIRTMGYVSPGLSGC